MCHLKKSRDEDEEGNTDDGGAALFLWVSLLFILPCRHPLFSLFFHDPFSPSFFLLLHFSCFPLSFPLFMPMPHTLFFLPPVSVAISVYPSHVTSPFICISICCRARWCPWWHPVPVCSLCPLPPTPPLPSPSFHL